MRALSVFFSTNVFASTESSAGRSSSGAMSLSASSRSVAGPTISSAFDPVAAITFTANGDEPDLRGRLKAPASNTSQDLYVSAELKTGHIMVKDEDVCLHCGLCAERCPTGAWDMQKFLLNTTQAGSACRDKSVGVHTS